MCASKREALLPITEAFVENVIHAHLQACEWKHALDPERPNIEPVGHLLCCFAFADVADISDGDTFLFTLFVLDGIWVRLSAHKLNLSPPQ